LPTVLLKLGQLGLSFKVVEQKDTSFFGQAQSGSDLG